MTSDRHGLMHDRQLAIFARSPRLGQVKTRLAEDLGAAEALRIYEGLLHETLGKLKHLAFPVWLYADGEGMEEIAARYGMTSRRQEGLDLGERMANAVAELLRTSRAAAVVGVDIPLLDANYVESAFDLLDSTDLVLGPTEDGGYCLVALKEMGEAIFEGIRWGSSAVLSETLACARELGLQVGLTKTLWDVDRAADVRRMLAT